MDKPLINDVSDTAFWIASHRARETARPDALFRDPLAKLLSGDHGDAIANSMPNSLITAWTIALRTHIIDQFILTAIQDGVDTILNLGAGLDTRPYRMDLPTDLRWIEVDFPGVMKFKEEKLSSENPKCKLERVQKDLALRDERKVLFAKLSSTSKKVLILTEGVAPYLTEQAVGELADDLKEYANFKYWIIDYFSPAMKKYRQKMQEKMKNAPFIFNPEDWHSFFGNHGWKVNQIKFMAEEGARLKRPMPLPLRFRIMIRLNRLLLSKERFLARGRFAGYAMLEQKSS